MGCQTVCVPLLVHGCSASELEGASEVTKCRNGRDGTGVYSPSLMRPWQASLIHLLAIPPVSLADITNRSTRMTPHEDRAFCYSLL